ncbi:MAG: hypothetical protein B7Z15_10365 [Rhizobiales bacterium 32-66-8]|nr:MAG: hypothetical protein B7Z15_10365 [Rhizobiales bacterium 32-66-8]
MLDLSDKKTTRLAAGYVLACLALCLVYLGFDLRRSWTESLLRLETHASGAAKWLDRGLETAADAMTMTAAAGADACRAGSVDWAALGGLTNVPINRIHITSTKGKMCDWVRPVAATQEPCSAIIGTHNLLVERELNGIRATATVSVSCLLMPFALAIEDISMALEPLAGGVQNGARHSENTHVTIASRDWPLQVTVHAPTEWIMRRWLADLPLQLMIFLCVASAVWFGPVSMLQRRLSVEGQVRTALRRGEFFLTYLPTIEIDSGNWVGVEALIRWRHARLGLLQPGAFIPWIEKSPLIHNTTQWVMGQAATDLKRMNELNGDLYVSINLPPTLLGDSRVVDSAVQAFGGAPLCLCRVMFELTEREPGDYSSPEVQGVVALLRQRGAQFALDDFGVGFSNLACLHAIDVDFIKVDKAFVQELEKRGGEPNVVNAIVRLAREFGVGIIAEGIETDRQLERIRRVGIRLAQGFLFSRPLEVDATLAELRLREDTN